MTNKVITIEKLTDKEWELAEKMKKLADQINQASFGAFLAGLVFALLICISLLYFGRSGEAVKIEGPESFLLLLLQNLAVFWGIIGIGALFGLMSYFVYFKRQAGKKLEEFKDLSADPHFLSVLRKLGQLQESEDETKKMKSIADAFDSKDLFNSKPLREFISSLPPV